MAYQEWGDAENPRVVVCVHGLTRISDDFVDLAAALKKDFRVVCPDVVGRGRSSWLKDPVHYGLPQYVGDMSALLAGLAADRVYWVGTSMGGLIGMALAAQPQAMIARLVLNDVGAELSGEALGRIAGYLGIKTRFAHLDEARAHLRAVFAGFGPHSEAQWQQITDAVLVKEADGWRLHYDPEIAAPFRAAYGPAFLEGKTPAPIDLWPVYEAVRCPTMVIRGADSDLLTAPVLQQMALRGPKARVLEIPGVGHAPSLMHDDQINAVAQFLSEDD
jgi:pimeloyl-ACP methyl ester carboxylesterase